MNIMKYDEPVFVPTPDLACKAYSTRLSRNAIFLNLLIHQKLINNGANIYFFYRYRPIVV